MWRDVCFHQWLSCSWFTSEEEEEEEERRGGGGEKEEEEEKIQVSSVQLMNSYPMPSSAEGHAAERSQLT